MHFLISFVTQDNSKSIQIHIKSHPAAEKIIWMMDDSSTPTGMKGKQFSSTLTPLS